MYFKMKTQIDLPFLSNEFDLFVLFTEIKIHTLYSLFSNKLPFYAEFGKYKT